MGRLKCLCIFSRACVRRVPPLQLARQKRIFEEDLRTASHVPINCLKWLTVQPGVDKWPTAGATAAITQFESAFTERSAFVDRVRMPVVHRRMATRSLRGQAQAQVQMQEEPAPAPLPFGLVVPIKVRCARVTIVCACGLPVP